MTPCFLRHFSNFLSVFLDVDFAAELDDAEATPPPMTSPLPESATTSTTASAEPSRKRIRRVPLDVPVFEYELVIATVCEENLENR